LLCVVLPVLLALAALAGAATAAATPMTTTGPVPPPGVKAPMGSMVAESGEVMVPNVPAYLWRHGCAPTSVGMVLGYYDRVYSQLIPGDASTQTEAVNQVIASQQTATITTPQHYEDYALPMDANTGTTLWDKSELPAGDEHTSNCVADFMYTSRSAVSLRYGWSWNSMVGPAFVGAVEMTTPDATPSTTDYTWDAGSLTWAVVKDEIDAGRPMVFFVDSTGDGQCDHAVAMIGYRETSGYPEYACWDTWFTTVRWARFREMTSVVDPAYSWGVWGGTALHVAPPVTPSPIAVSAPLAANSWPSGSTQTVSWTLGAATSGGEFRVSLVSAGGTWYVNKQVLPVAGQTVYSTQITAAVPAGSYRAAVYWRPSASDPWAATTKSAAFTVTPINVTVPAAGAVWPTQATCTVSWNVNPAMAAGEFQVSLINQTSGTWYVNRLVAATAGKVSYSAAVNTLVPPGSYKAAVYWRATVGTGLWTATQKSAAFTIATLAVSDPTASSSWPRLTTQTVAWSVTPGLASGEFRVSLVSAANVWYVNKVVPVVPGQVPYSTGLLVNVPAGAYRAAVYWRPAGSATWVLTKKTAAFTVTP
jgi:hypothetical protein